MNMNTNVNHETPLQSETPSSLKTACIAFCQKTIRQIQKVKNALLADYARMMHGQEQAVRLALNEAEALAWETDFPHLVFPDLAVEKVEALANWRGRQQAIQSTRPEWGFAS